MIRVECQRLAELRPRAGAVPGVGVNPAAPDKPLHLIRAAGAGRHPEIHRGVKSRERGRIIPFQVNRPVEAGGQHLQFPFGGKLERQLEILGRINRVSNDRNHVQIEIFHVERNIPAAMTARGDEPALKGKGSERFRKRDRIADIVQHNIDP